MKCEKCGNEYPSEYYFSAPGVCTNCYGNMSDDERQQLNTALFSKFAGFDFSTRTGFGMRLLAWLLDFVLSTILLYVVLYFMGDLEYYLESFSLMFSNQMEFDRIQLEFLPIIVFLSFVYNSLEVFLAASAGKIILRLQIGSADGKKASIRALVIRFLIKNIYTIFSFLFLVTGVETIQSFGLLLFFVILIGCFFVLAQKRQAFHDMFAKTAVYKNHLIAETEN